MTLRSNLNDRNFDLNFEPARNSVNLLNVVQDTEPARYSKRTNELNIEPVRNFQWLYEYYAVFQVSEIVYNIFTAIYIIIYIINIYSMYIIFQELLNNYNS